MEIREEAGKFKIFIIKDWCYMCQLINGKWQDLEFNTREEAEREVEQTRDHLKAIETGEWEEYARKWNIELL
ncbi:MAG: hypothetical protein WCS56_05835 [Bacilli bacterium]